MKPLQIEVTKGNNSLPELEEIVNSRKNIFEYNEQNIIDSDRYQLHTDKKGNQHILGEGCWGIVYSFYDKLTDESVAIKVHKPNHIALDQMGYRNLNPLEAFQKEGGKRKFKACANVVPTDFELDAEGRPFLVMPQYKIFLHELLDKVSNRSKGVEKETNYGMQKPHGSGLYLDEIVHILEQLSNGLSEFHEKYERAHCDIKPDNIAVDVNDENFDPKNWDIKDYDIKQWKFLISDKGTSTFASVKAHSGPRDNMGCIDTRSLRLFLPNEVPSRKDDVYSIGGSLAFKLFTGHYPFEDEFNDAFENGKMDYLKIKKFINQFYDNDCGGLCTHLSNIQESIDKKLKKTRIPSEFKSPIQRSLAGHSYDGVDLKRDLAKAESEYLEHIGGKKVRDEFKKNLIKKALGAFLGGTTATSAILGLGWLIYFNAAPDFNMRRDIYTVINDRPVELCELPFKVEQSYEGMLPDLKPSNEYKNLLNHHLDKYKDVSLADKLTTIWIKTGSELQASVIAPLDHRNRTKYRRLGGWSDNEGNPIFINDYIREILVQSLWRYGINKDAVDLDEVLTTAYLNIDTLHETQKAANSFRFEDYVQAKKPDGEYIIPEKKQEFLRRLIYNVSKAFSDNIRLE